MKKLQYKTDESGLYIAYGTTIIFAIGFWALRIGEFSICFDKKLIFEITVCYPKTKTAQYSTFIFRDWLRKTFLKPIYYIHWSRDCDMCESESAGVIYGRKHYEAMMEEAGEWDDGPLTFTEISKAQYENYVAPPVRDRVMEAFENGRATSIYV